MGRIHQLIPRAEDLLTLEPEELAPALLDHIRKDVVVSWKRSFKRGNVFIKDTSPGHDYGPQFADKVDEALTAAWIWLEREGLLLPDPASQDRDWLIVSKRGDSLLSKEDFEAYARASLFPRGKALHPAISSSTFALFLRGHYDTVVFEAMRAVEVAVRKVGRFDLDVVGVSLVRKAFAPESGPLTDKGTLIAEQEATANLFAGAMGLFKNPTSHRACAITNPEDTVAIVMLADYLLRLVDQRGAPRW